MTDKTPRDHSLLIKAFRAYVQFVNSGLYFKKEHVIGLENVPANGTPTIIVSNGKTNACALSCNVLSVKYVATVDRLHIAFPVYLVYVHSRVKPCEDKNLM